VADANDKVVPQPPAESAWRDAWQGPALVGGALALVAAGVYAFISRPKHDVLEDFRSAQERMEAKEYASALQTLGQRVLPVLNKGGLTKEQEQGFYLMRARALYLGQREAGVDRKENHENILAEYVRATKAGADLAWQDEIYLLRTHVSLGDLDKAARSAHRTVERTHRVEPRNACGPSARTRTALAVRG
jgi:hypothetical protein